MKDLTNDVVIHKKAGEFEILQFRKLLDLGIKHAYTLKPHFFNTKPGVISKERYEKSVENYKKLCNEIGVDYNKLVKPNQTHTNCVKPVNNMPQKMIIEDDEFTDTDGAITNIEGVTLASCNADCIIVLFYDPVKKVIGNIHSGWKGTFKKITVNCINKMITDYGCNPNDIIVCICPSIRKCCFEVKEDVKRLCEKIFEYTNRLDDIINYVGKDEEGIDKWMIDTVLITKILLADCGIKDYNVYDCGICSYCNKDIINSCRGDGKSYGLSTAIISL